MADLWRFSNYPNLNGEGGFRYSARWHTAGRRIVYLAESPAGALLEVLVHLELGTDEVPPTYTLLHVQVPDSLALSTIGVPPGNAWMQDESVTRQLGDAWLMGARSASLRVPSVILPHTFNVLLNPVHAEAALFSIIETTPTPLDPRLLRRS